MIGENRVVALVPARAGSKGVPGKNLREIAGDSLLAWAVKTAQAVDEIDRVIVSTDGEEIGEAARSLGAEVWERPAELATDEAVMTDVLRDVIARLRAEGEMARYIVLLEPTSPGRLADDIRTCLQLLEDGHDSAATFTEAELHPHRAWRIEDGSPSVFVEGAVPWLPRQLLPPAFQLNGAVYAFVMDALPADSPSLVFGNTAAVLMERERSIDVDDETGLLVADQVLRRRG